MFRKRERFTPDPDRGTGRTKAMVKSLPEGGCCVVVHSRDFIRYVRNMIGDLRGSDFLKSVRFASIHDLETLRGLDLPIHVDHFVLEHAWNRHLHFELKQLEMLKQYQALRKLRENQ